MYWTLVPTSTLRSRLYKIDVFGCMPFGNFEWNEELNRRWDIGTRLWQLCHFFAMFPAQDISTSVGCSGLIVDEATTLNSNWKLYPNPTSKSVFMFVLGGKISNLWLHQFDRSAKILVVFHNGSVLRCLPCSWDGGCHLDVCKCRKSCVQTHICSRSLPWR